jgi:hypothetical protein
MNSMSRRSIKEYILRQQEDYIGEPNRRRRSRMLDEVCRVTGLGRKYVIRLLRGTRSYRVHPGRGKSYGPDEVKLLVEAWEGSGCLCAKYLKADIGRWLRYLGELQNVHPGVAARVAAMSASTMERILKGRPRTAKAWGRRNRRSGRNGVMALVPCESGEDVPVWEIGPGDVQVDSVAFCGGIAEGDFLWAATATDRWSGWFEARPSFNLCAANYRSAFQGNLEAMPFPIRRVHSDSGPELVNSVIYEYMTGHWPRTRFSRSWPGRKNHNAHIEQKNGSVLRAFVGDVRLDHPKLQRAFGLLLEGICDYHNYVRPCVMLTSKVKRVDGKGFRRTYDNPTTPVDRLLESGKLDPATAERLRKKRDSINGVHLMELIQKRLRHLLALRKRLVGGSLAAGDLALRAAPSGPSPAAGEPRPPDVPKASAGEVDTAVPVSSI